MNFPKLATAFAAAALLAASESAAEFASTAAIRQPAAVTPSAVPAPVVTTVQPAVTAIQQPPIGVPEPGTAQPPAARQPWAVADQQSAAVLQQPGTLTADASGPNSTAESRVIAAQPLGAAMQQPSAFVAPGIAPTVVGTPAMSAILQQPSAIGSPASAFASYYDDDDEESDDEEDDDSRCGHGIGCGDGDCERGPTCCGFTCGGWIEQGFTFNPYDPSDGNNGTVILNDLANQYMMNQLWLYAEREVDNGGVGWDWGGRFDVVYGTDGQYFQMVDGLEESWGQTGHYQIALLRFYFDVAFNDWTLRAGRWDTPVGYEPFDATESFFYSRSYNFYAQPGSLLGLLLTRHLNDQWSISAGLHRGDMQFDDTDGKNALGFIGGVGWDSPDEESFLDFYLQTDEEGVGVDTLDYSIFGGTPINENWDYVFEWYWGNNDQFGKQSEWYGLNQHFIRTINDCWSYGFRFEWFRDDDGFIITNFPRGNSAQGPFDGNFFELTYAINYRPCENFVLRPELRYDWFDASAPSPRPFDDNTKNDQFLLSIDAIYTF
jgi:hypothetical protein